MGRKSEGVSPQLIEAMRRLREGSGREVLIEDLSYLPGPQTPDWALDFALDLDSLLEEIDGMWEAAGRALRSWLYEGLSQREAARREGIGTEAFAIAREYVRIRLVEYIGEEI